MHSQALLVDKLSFDPNSPVDVCYVGAAVNDNGGRQ